MTHTIKILGTNDLALARELIRCWSRDEDESNPALPTDVYLQKLLDKADFHILVAMTEHKVIGGLSAYELPMFDREETEIFLYEIGVSKAFRKQGIARSLIRNLQQLGVEKGIREIFVGTETDNYPARKLYQNTGAKEEPSVWYIYKQNLTDEKN